MKFVTTAQSYRQLVLERDDETGEPTKLVSRVPLEVSNDDADRIVKLGESVGVAIVVTDDEPEATDPAPVGQPTPDLSAGRSAITGTGDPVTDTTTTDEPEKPAKKGR